MSEGYPGQDPEQSVERIVLNPEVTIFLLGSGEGFSANCGKCNRPQPANQLPDFCSDQDCIALWENVTIRGDVEAILEQIDPEWLGSRQVYPRELVRFEKPRSAASEGLDKEITIEDVPTGGYF